MNLHYFVNQTLKFDNNRNVELMKLAYIQAIKLGSEISSTIFSNFMLIMQ